MKSNLKHTLRNEYNQCMLAVFKRYASEYSQTRPEYAVPSLTLISFLKHRRLLVQLQPAKCTVLGKHCLPCTQENVHLAGLPITNDLYCGIHCEAIFNEKGRSGVHMNILSSVCFNKKYKKRASGRKTCTRAK